MINRNISVTSVAQRAYGGADTHTPRIFAPVFAAKAVLDCAEHPENEAKTFQLPLVAVCNEGHRWDPVQILHRFK